MLIHLKLIATSSGMARTSYSPRDGERLSTAVVNAIADHEGADTDEIRPHLYDVIDPDALDSLFAPRVDGRPRSGGRAVFTYHERRITVHGDGWVYVEDASDGTSESETAAADE